jgi:hypothetical protein
MTNSTSTLSAAHVYALNRLSSATRHEAQRPTGTLASVTNPTFSDIHLLGNVLTFDAVPTDNLVRHPSGIDPHLGGLLVDAKGLTEAGPLGRFARAIGCEGGYCRRASQPTAG